MIINFWIWAEYRVVCKTKIALNTFSSYVYFIRNCTIHDLIPFFGRKAATENLARQSTWILFHIMSHFAPKGKGTYWNTIGFNCVCFLDWNSIQIETSCHGCYLTIIYSTSINMEITSSFWKNIYDIIHSLTKCILITMPAWMQNILSMHDDQYPCLPI